MILIHVSVLTYIYSHITWSSMKVSYHPDSFNMKMRAKSPAALSMITCWVIFFFPSLVLRVSRVNTFKRLGASVYRAFIMATKQSRLLLCQFVQAVEINQHYSGLPQIAHHTIAHSFRWRERQSTKMTVRSRQFEKLGAYLSIIRTI